MEKNKQQKIDANSRKNIRESINENYFVEAGAGSGKTTVLVDRMAEMIRQGKDISHISAITFTKAAANEFYDRFEKKLIEKSLENDKDKQKYLDALQNIDLAFMGTIDSFCNTIMSEHPNEGLIPSNSRIINNDEAIELYKNEYANIQNGLYKDANLEAKAKTFLKYDEYPQETFMLTLNALLNHRDCTLQISNYLIDNIDTKFKDEIKTIRKIVQVLTKHPEYIKSSNEEYAEQLRKSLENNKYIFDHNWDDNVPKILNAFKYTFFANYNKSKNASNFRLYFADEVRDELKEGIDFFVSHKDKWYDINYDKLSFATKYIEKIKYLITIDFVNDAKTHILNKLRKQGLLTFNDYLVYLRDTLRKDAACGGKLIKHIYDKHKYFLIDEFQDTDPIQAEIFFYLAAKDIKLNWRDCIPHKGSLFIVGDPKQSIYRFKNADVTSYLKVKEMFKAPVGEVLYLYENFRSTYEVKDYFNETFKGLLKESLEQAEFEEIPNAKKDDVDAISDVYKYDVLSKSDSLQGKDEYIVKDIILKLYNNPDFKISYKKKENDKDVYTTKLIDWNDFMVITHSKDALSKYTKALREAGIPYFVEGNIKFNESKAFEIFVDYFGAVVCPKDNRYLYKILKSNLFNIKEADLSEAIDNGLILNVLEDTSKLSLKANLKDALDKLRGFAVQAKELNSSTLFTMIINNVEGFKKQGTENMEYIYFALELLKSKVNSKEIITNIDALRFLENLLEKTNEQERCPGLKLDGNQVHLANLHKVKGLEAPIVILANPIFQKKEAEFRMERDDKGNKGYLFSVSKKLNSGLYVKVIKTDSFDSPYKTLEEESMEAEKLRLEYVAATRAKNILIISNAINKGGDEAANNYWKDLLNNDLKDIKDALANYEPKSYSKNPVDFNSIKLSNNILKDNESALLTNKIIISNPSKLTSIISNEDAEIDQRIQKQIYENNGDSLSAIIGTMVHRLMEFIVLSRNKINKDEAINNIINEYLMSDFKEKEDEFRKILNDVYETINNGGDKQKGKVTQDILKVLLEADELYSEVPFEYKENNTIWNGIIDLIYIKDNKAHIIDWKTNKDDNNLDEHYKEQLNAYIKAINKIIDIEAIDAYIYHINIYN